MIAELKALPALLHDEGGDAPGADVRSGDGENHIGVRLGSVGDEDLAAVKEVVIPLVQRGGLRAAGIGAGVGLRQAEGADFLALGQRDQIFLLLLLGAVGENGPRAEGDMGGKDHARAAVHTGQLLHRDGVTQGVKTGAAVLLGVRNAHPAQLTQLLDSLLGKLIVLVHQKCEGLDLLLRKAPDLRAQLFMRRRGLK